MTVEDQIGYLQSKIASLEAKLALLESRGEDPITEGRLHMTPQPAVDPKGRKIWEAEWRGDYKVMMAYVPDNALIIDGENVEVDADDKEGDEVTLSDGSWYLHAYKNKTTGNWEAELDQEPTGTREDEEAKYNIHICDIHEDGYIEKQYVVGSIVLGGGNAVFMGDTEDSKPTDGRDLDGGDNSDIILIQGQHVETEDSGDIHPVSGLMARTGPAEDNDGENPFIILDVIDRKDVCEDGAWGAKTMTVTPKEGSAKTIHFLGCDDIDIDLSDSGGGGGGAENVIGSDYIKVEDEEEEDDHGNVTTKRKVSAKIQTSDPNPSSPVEHALLTHDTDQLVRSKKTFLGSSPIANSKKVIVDGPNGRVEVKDATGNKTIKLDADDIPGGCGGELKVHELKFKDEEGNEHTYHGLFCADIDLTKEGKLIKSTTVTASAAPNGMNTIKFIYTDDTYDEFNVMNGMNGSPGSPGKDGDTPEITAERRGNHVYIYADGDLIATLEDGNTPEITAQRTSEKQTTIYANGIAIAVINDGEDGQGGSGDDLTEMEMVTGVTFELSGNTLNAKVTKKKVKAVFVENVSEQTVKVADVGQLDVVVSESYNNGGDVTFKNVRKRINVIGTPNNAQGQNVFTTTPLSGENV